MHDPAQDYSRRHEAAAAAMAAQQRRSDRLARGRLAAFLAGVLVAGLALAGLVPEALLLLPVLLFFGLVALHARTLDRLAAARTAADHYRRGLERLAGGPGDGPAGEDFLDPEHPYAEHLDLFGPRALFPRLCAAGTLPGRRTLAAWLLAPAAPGEIRRRQEAVDELRGAVDLREALETETARRAAGLDPARFAAFAGLRAGPPSALLRVGLAALGAAIPLSLAGWLGGDLAPWWFLLLVTVGWWTGLRLRGRLDPLLRAVEGGAGQLEPLAAVLAHLEDSTWSSPRLAALREGLLRAGRPPSRRIRALRRRLEMLDSARNLLLAPFAVLVLWRWQWGLAVQAWMAREGDALPRWIEAVGDFEALLSLSRHAFENPDDPWPELVGEGPLLEGEGLGHPLLPAAAVVRNDLRLDEDLRLYVVSGSNMSGKSTLLRTVGCNVVLAQAGAPVRARRLRLSPWSVGASLRIVDSLPAGISHFYAEVRRLRALMDLTGGARPALLLLDEIFHGTNSHDRRRGAAAVLRRLLERGAAVLVTTHDLALARLAEDLGPVARNVHFEDQIADERMVFDYRMRPGVAGEGNALRIMRNAGLLEGPPGD